MITIIKLFTTMIFNFTKIIQNLTIEPHVMDLLELLKICTTKHKT